MKYFAIICLLCCFGCTPDPSQPAPYVIPDARIPFETPEPLVDPECEPGGDCCLKPSFKLDDGTFLDAGNHLSGRYYLRDRTKKFFGRVV